MNYFRLAIGLSPLLTWAFAFQSCSLFPRFPTRINAETNRAYGGALSKIPIVICPGFGNDQTDYLNPLNQGTEAGFVSALVRRGFDPDLIQVLPLQRIEWVRVAGGLFDFPNFYRGTMRPDGLGYGWYVKRLRHVVEEMYVKGGKEEKVLLIGHSAGGWLARAALGDGSWDLGSDNEGEDAFGGARAANRVRALVTVGAIHKPPAGNAAATCVTRGALAYIDDKYPGAYLAGEGISYVSVGGDAVFGRKENPRQPVNISEEKIGSKEVNDIYKVRGEGSASTVAFTAYEAVSGNGKMTGDGVVPLEWSLLEGSRKITLDGVLHSINEPGTTLPTDRWYGSEGVVDRWLTDALEEAGIVERRKNSITGAAPWISVLEMLFPGV
eukprot:CAMPEP_0171330546 /NCGR_PEP_ID=MMETSP0878-20121228/2076_1 /TAXON_ID=67004 /ORGANISM="Thalassiosira weissflogii, Strain CCMP1336" /LENGTH=381 /DNA_ID=CAMNT_0011830863 /DNA_START=343 /DNA_END=1488 /DNA_ORIENTATION=-